jgi:hypothetical protein
MISLGLPNDPSEVVAIGKVAIRHGQLDHGLKLTIRSIRGISVEQALAETKRKSVHQLQALVEEHARDRFGEAPPPGAPLAHESGRRLNPLPKNH